MVDATLLCFGFGYCAQHYAGAFGERFTRIVGTTRSTSDLVTSPRARGEVDRAQRGRVRGLLGDFEPLTPTLSPQGGEREKRLDASLAIPDVEGIQFDGGKLTTDLAAALAAATHILVSIPPGDGPDPVLACCADALAASPARAIVYLSTVGVYGNHDGAWVDEATPPGPNTARSEARLAAERAWLDFAARSGKSMAILRLAGIYGPGQNAIEQLRAGTAKRIVKPGQVFNRIHVADIARAIEGAFAAHASGLFNVSDDEPAPAPDVVAYAAGLLGLAPPPEIAFDQASKTMSPMAISFYAGNKRVRNDKMKRGLRVTLKYPTYREGLRDLLRGA